MAVLHEIRTGPFALSAGGFAFTALLLVLGRGEPFPIPGGDVLIFDRAGDALRAGLSPYGEPGSPTLYYAPSWALVFALVSWLPPAVLHVGFAALAVLSLRYMFGSWLRVGYVCWCPLVAFELAAGQLNLFVAAAIVAGIRRDVPLAVAGALAKIGPAFALDPRDWRRFLIWSGIAVAVTLPWLSLWPDWIALLVGTAQGPPLGPVVPLPYPFRLAAAILLLLVRGSWARALAAALAVPAFYWISLLLLLAPLAVVLEPKIRRPTDEPIHTI